MLYTIINLTRYTTHTTVTSATRLVLGTTGAWLSALLQPREIPLPKMAPVRLSAFSIRAARSPYHQPIHLPDGDSGQVEHDHECRYHHLVPLLIEGCGLHVIARPPVRSSRMSLPRHLTSSKQGRALPTKGTIHEAGAIFQLDLGLKALDLAWLWVLS